MSLWGSAGSVIVVMVSGIVYVFTGFAVSDRSCVVECINYGGPTGASATIGGMGDRVHGIAGMGIG